MPTLTQLEYALAVATERHFGRAAASCHVSQPALSAQIAKLEEEIGVVLFDRSRKPVAVTEAGVSLLRQFAVVRREVERIDEIVHEQQEVVAGTYRLGVIPTLAPHTLPAFVPPFVAAHPEVKLSIEEATTDEIIERLVAEDLDGGLLATPLGDSRIVEFPIANEELLVFHADAVQLPRDRYGRVPVDDLPTTKLLVMQEGHCLRTQALDLCALEKNAQTSFSLVASSLSTLVNMVDSGPYFTIIPALAADEIRARGGGEQLAEIAGPAPYREVALVAHRTQTRRAIREALLHAAKSHLAPRLRTRRRRRDAPIAPL